MRLRLRSLWIAGGWAIAAVIVWLSITPSPPKIDIDEGDKLGHLLAYGTLMFWFCQLYAGRGARAAHAAGFALMGVALEFVQDALGYRSYDVYDMLANTVGVALGWAAALPTGGKLFKFAELMLPERRR